MKPIANLPRPLTFGLSLLIPLLLIGAALLPAAAAAAPALVGAGVLLLVAGGCLGQRQLGRLTRKLAAAEARQTELAAELADAQTRYQQILHHASDAIFFVDPHDGRLLEVNRRAEEMLGYSCGDIRHLSLGILFPGRHRRRFLKLVRKILKHGYGEEAELQFRCRDGSLFFGAVHARLGWLGKQRVVQGSFRDVTPNVHLAAELRRHNQQLELLNEIAERVAEGRNLSSILSRILDQVVDGFGVAGGGIYLLRNQRSEMELAFHRGIPPAVQEELTALRLGEGLSGRVALSGQPRLSVDISKDRRCGISSVTRDGWRAFLAVPMTAEESCLGVLFIFDRGMRVLNRHDLRLLQSIGRQIGPLVKNAELFDELQWQHRINQASLRELERSRAALRDNLQQLEEHHRMLQGLDQMKSTFLALASHELRTPLTVICSGAELLKTTAAEELDEAGQCALEAILHGSQRLRAMVDDLLEAARLEANAIYLARECFDPRPMIEELVETCRPVCEQRRLNCSLSSLPGEISIRGDMHHLKRALGHLVENAVKFTPEGGWIRIDTALRGGSEVEAMAGRLSRFSSTFFKAPRVARYLEVRVRDSGIGLPPGAEERIFEKFYAGGDIDTHSSSREQFGGKGVGLGLTLARGLIAAHEGILWAESAGLSRGSSFCLLLPLHAAEGTDDGS